MLPLNEIIILRSKGIGSKRLAEKYHTNRKTIQRLLHKINIENRGEIKKDYLKCVKKLVAPTPTSRIAGYGGIIDFNENKIIDPKISNVIFELKKSGFGSRAISDKLNISRDKVRNILRKVRN